jgi:YD repeat-containing protein
MLNLLPAEIFTVIRSYVEEYQEYRNLMNTNKAMFSFIKYETIQYDIKCQIHDLSRLHFVSSGVKNSKDQMELALKFLSIEKTEGKKEKEILDFFVTSFSAGLKLLKCKNCPFENSFFQGFKNVEQIIFFGCRFLSTISNELVGVKELHLCFLPNLIDISGIAKSKELETVKLFGCNAVSDVCGLRNIKNVTVGHCNLITSIDRFGNHESFTWMDARRPKSINITDVTQLKLTKNLFVFDAILNCDYTCLQDITGELYLSPYGDSSCPVNMTYFKGYKLGFVRLSIIHLTELLLNSFNLKVLELNSCTGFDVVYFQTVLLPQLSLRELSLCNYYEIKSVMGMEKIRVLKLNNLPNLSSLSNLGKKRHIHLGNMPLLTDFSSLTEVPEISICDCAGLNSLAHFRKAWNIELIRCSNISDVGDLKSCEILTLSNSRDPSRNLPSMIDFACFHFDVIHFASFE